MSESVEFRPAVRSDLLAIVAMHHGMKLRLD